jgi:hypothetical protein
MGMTTHSAFASAADAGRRWLETLQSQEPITFGTITVLPLKAVQPLDPPWLLLNGTLTASSVEVREISDRGTVPTIHVTNGGDRDLLLLDGEELIGAKQNRVLNTTVLVRAHSTLEVPVSCVEQERWSYDSPRFTPSGHSLYASIRLKKAAWIHASLRQRRSHESDQAGLWHDLSEKAAALSVKTSAMSGAFGARASDLGEYRQALVPRPDQVGALVFNHAAWCGMDVLPSPRLFAEAWPRLLSGYVLDALCLPPEWRPGGSGPEPLRALLDAAVETFPGLGAGEDCRFSGPAVRGAALVVDGIVAHAMAFPTTRHEPVESR